MGLRLYNPTLVIITRTLPDLTFFKVLTFQNITNLKKSFFFQLASSFALDFTSSLALLIANFLNYMFLQFPEMFALSRCKHDLVNFHMFYSNFIICWLL